jgi:hypothetical protein
LVVTVGEDIGFYEHCLSDNALDGEPATVDFRRNLLNYDSASSVRRLFRHLSQNPSCDIGPGSYHSRLFDGTPVKTNREPGSSTRGDSILSFALVDATQSFLVSSLAPEKADGIVPKDFPQRHRRSLSHTASLERLTREGVLPGLWNILRKNDM